MTFLEAILLGIALAIAFQVGRSSRRRAVTHEAYPLDFLALNGYSLQCLRGTNGEDDLFAVTDGSSKVIGKPAYTPRDAIDSAIGHVAFEHTGDEA